MDGTTVLVLGILGVVFCHVLGPLAWCKGNAALADIDARPGQYSNRSIVAAGRILGIVSTCVLVVVILVLVASLVLVIAAPTPDPDVSPYRVPLGGVAAPSP